MRRFLEDFAKKSGFDPLLADNWYNITKEDISRYKVLIQGRMREGREGRSERKEERCNMTIGRGLYFFPFQGRL